MTIPHSRCTEAPCRAFTLIELLAAVAVVGILTALIFPSVRGVLDQSKRSRCQANLKQIAAAGLMYIADNNGCFPAPDKIINPWQAGGTYPGVDPATLPLNEYLQNSREVFRCPSDTAPYAPFPGAPSWAAEPFFDQWGTSYYYNSYPTTIASIMAGTNKTALAGLRISQINNPSRMVFFADQDARAFASSSPTGDYWKRITLWWHAKPGTQLRANIAFVDGSVRLADIRPEAEADFTFYNN